MANGLVRHFSNAVQHPKGHRIEPNRHEKIFFDCAYTKRHSISYITLSSGP